MTTSDPAAERSAAPSGPALPRYQLAEMPGDLALLLAPRVERLGYLGEFFQYMAGRPEALTGFIVFSEEAKKGLADDLTETVALSVSVVMGNPYERNQHERLCRTLGFTSEWIGAVEALEPDGGDVLTEAQRAVQRLVLAALRPEAQSARAQLDPLMSLIDEGAVVSVLMLIGRYVAHSVIVRSLGLEAPVPSVFQAHAGG